MFGGLMKGALMLAVSALLVLGLSNVFEQRARLQVAGDRYQPPAAPSFAAVPGKPDRAKPILLGE